MKATVAPAPTTSQIVWGPQNRKLGKQDHATRKADFPPRAEEEGEGAGEKAGRGPLARGETEGRRGKVEKGVESLTDGRTGEERGGWLKVPPTPRQ